MRDLSSLLNDEAIQNLQNAIDRELFPGISFDDAMSFLLTDGVIPKSGLPVHSFLKLEDWARNFQDRSLNYTATELKNKTGEILERVLQGQTARIVKHGRPIAEIRRVQAQNIRRKTI